LSKMQASVLVFKLSEAAIALRNP